MEVVVDELELALLLALKQNKTDENSRLVREKKRELKLLDDEFKEVLKE